MLGLDDGDGRGNRRNYYACYRLLDGGVYNLEVSGDFLKTGNYFKKLIYVYDSRGVIKTRKRGFCYSHFSYGDVKKRVFWLGDSYAIKNFLEGGVDAKSLFIACTVLEFMDSANKALHFCWKRKENHNLRSFLISFWK